MVIQPMKPLLKVASQIHLKRFQKRLAFTATSTHNLKALSRHRDGRAPSTSKHTHISVYFRKQHLTGWLELSLRDHHGSGMFSILSFSLFNQRIPFHFMRSHYPSVRPISAYIQHHGLLADSWRLFWIGRPESLSDRLRARQSRQVTT